MKLKQLMYSAVACGLLISGTVKAGMPGSYNTRQEPIAPMYVAASLGYGEYSNMYQNDGQSPIGRLAFGQEMLLGYDFSVGYELGVQNGTVMRLPLPLPASLVFGTPVQTTLKPLIDLLLTVKSPCYDDTFFALVKGGVTYRRWQFDNVFINDKDKVDLEIQAGVGFVITERANLNLVYQGIFANSSNFTYSTRNGVVLGQPQNIPALNSVLLTLQMFM